MPSPMRKFLFHNVACGCGALAACLFAGLFALTLDAAASDWRLSGVYSPGASPGCNQTHGSVGLGASSTLLMEIAGTQACLEYDRFIVGNTLSLEGGTLRLSLLGGFEPQAGQQFDLLNWGTLSGTFFAIDESAAALAPGLAWDFSQLYVDGSVTVVALEATAVPLPVSAVVLGAIMLLGIKLRAIQKLTTRQLR